MGYNRRGGGSTHGGGVGEGTASFIMHTLHSMCAQFPSLAPSHFPTYALTKAIQLFLGRYLPGVVESRGERMVEHDKCKDRLLQVKGRRNIRLQQVGTHSQYIQ